MSNDITMEKYSMKNFFYTLRYMWMKFRGYEMEIDFSRVAKMTDEQRAELGEAGCAMLDALAARHALTGKNTIEL